MSPNELGLVAKHVMKLLVERRFDELEKASNSWVHQILFSFQGSTC